MKEVKPKEAAIVFSSFSFICVAVLFALTVYDVVTLQDLLSFADLSTIVWSTLTSSLGLLLFGVILTLITPANNIDDTNKSYQNHSVPVILAFMLAGALFEELLFRGIVQNLLYVYTGNQWASILITALLFVAIHVQYYKKPLMLINIAVPGLVFGWVYALTGNLLVPFVAHFVMNAGITLLFKYNVIRLKK
ncbi:CPBP family intramembrane glutamic endopeptidase [Paenibacillus camerounensis]|uniref:CPBP family intramembrane glutamic endopeptidase n=1 Tax=Paenibacillus camerounensis TaxID=1243663 RepID=UPI0005A95BC4|nr:CPBP family intramembrane glutamic endopeptidase [Paenibacillus camerounensis]